MNLVEWSTVIGAGATLVTGGAAVVIAFLAHRFSVQTEQNEAERRLIDQKREDKREIQEAGSEFLTAYDGWLNLAGSTSGRAEEVIGRGRRLVNALSSAGKDAREAAAALSVIDGQQFWLRDVDDRVRWVLLIADQSHREWAASVTNGLLDVVKDAVLVFEPDRDDFSLIDESFWTELATPCFEGEGASIREPHVPEDLYAAAERRWLSPQADQGARARIRALVRYRVLAEHSLAFMLFASFNDGTGEKGREEKFILSCRAVMSRLVQDLLGTAHRAVEEIDDEIRSLM